ncbi:hypothetical protein M6D81_26305 [Paenibacillus sp. J5C_2022]|nr:hypothetical protein [Paenibacillus sp. J5C2022]MCU6712218.1 hypothetical protein [Paenibacillus sp. J5C2022]
MPHRNGHNDSKAQRSQAARNAARSSAADANGIDKKLNGPNRPST